MAEIILPPEENEETPQAPELNIDKPTENSKVITIEFEAKKTAQVSTKDTNQQLYTTDTDAWFEFKETTLENANGTYSVVFRNRHDGSIFQRTGDVVNGVAYYKIPHQEIRHVGAWRGQLVYTLENGNTTAREFDYVVKGHILDGKDVREIVVEDFETLMSQLRNMKDNAELELANLTQELKNTAEQNEADRQTFFDDLVEDIDDLQAHYQELLDTGVLQTNINTKLEALEEEYAPKLTEVTTQLAQKLNKGENESITSAMLSPEIKQALNDGEWNVNINTSDIEQGAVTAEKINEEVGLFERISPKFTMGATSISTGELQESMSYMSTNYLLPFNLGDSVILIGGTDDIRLRISYFDKEGQYIDYSTLYIQSVENRVFKSTVDGYIKITLSKPGSPPPTITDVELVEFSKKIVLVTNRLKNIDEKVKIKQDSVTTETIKKGAVTIDKLDSDIGLMESFNPGLLLGYRSASGNVEEVHAGGRNFSTSEDFISLNPSDSIIIKGSPIPDSRIQVMNFDENLERISNTWQNQGTNDRTINPPVGTRFVVFNYELLGRTERTVTRNILGELAKEIVIHRNILKINHLSKIENYHEIETQLNLEIGELAVDLSTREVKYPGQNLGTRDITSDYEFLKNRVTGKYLKVIPGTEINLTYDNGNAVLFEYNKEFNFIDFTNIYTNQPMKLKETTAHIKIVLKDLTVRNIRPILKFQSETTKPEWSYNLNQPNRTQDNITFIYEVFTNEGRDILNPDGTEKQYAEGQYFNTGILKLPPNYDPNGEPVKLIIYVQGSSGYNVFNSHSPALGYERGYSSNTFGYLLDEGYAIMSVYQWTSKYADMGGTHYGGTNTGSPIAMSAYANGLKWVTDNYNIEDKGVYISGVSAGGFCGISLMYNNAIPTIATGLLVPTITPTKTAFGSNEEQRKAYADDFGFVGDYELLNNQPGGSPAVVWTPELEDFIRDNLHRTIGYNPRWNGIINEDLDVLVERGAMRQEDDYELNKNQKRLCPVPVKFWVAEDDDRISYDGTRLFIKSIQNANGNAEIRTMPNGTGGHSSIGGSEDTIVVENITTRLGIEQTNVPLAVVEMVQYFRRFES